MLIYSVKGGNASSKTQETVKCTETSKLHSLKTVIETLSKFQMSDSRPESDLFGDYSFKNEDAEAHYVTLIKYLLRTVKQDLFKMLYEASNDVFPMLKILLKYSHHSDIMIKNSARISLMTIFQKCRGENMEYITSVTILEHLNDIILHLKQAALDMQSNFEKFNITATEKAYLCYQEELEYIDDILRLNHSTKKLIICRLLNDLIVPFIFAVIIYETQQVEHVPPISCRIALCLLSKLLQIITEFEMKDCIIQIILQEKEIPLNIKIKDKYIMNCLEFILLKHKTDAETLHILYIFHVLQSDILERGTENGKNFSDNIPYILIKLLMINPHMKCLQLKLLTSIFMLSIETIIKYDSGWPQLHLYFVQAVQNIYINISKEIQHKTTNLIEVIDEEYETFINLKLDKNKISNDVNCLFEDHKTIDNPVNYMKTLLCYLFCIRHLYLELTNQEEKVLPVMKVKEKIGKIMFLDDCIQCKRLICDNFYNKEHYLMMTDRQLLILQNIENGEKGIVVFNSYYKDIIWSTNANNNTLEISELSNYTSSHSKNISKPFFIQLKFCNNEDLQFIRDVVMKAKLNQIKIVRKKLGNLLLTHEKAEKLSSNIAFKK